MSHTKSLNTSLSGVLIAPNNEHVFICDFSTYDLHIMFDDWWASMDVSSKRAGALNNSRHLPSWRFYLHFGIEETSTSDTLCIVCYQVLRHSSGHGSS
jgi:hypothetical protein